MHTQADLDFEAVVGWESLPEGYVHKDVSDVATDSEDNVYLLTRYDSRVIVYDSAGSFVRSWGEDTLSDRPHGISVGPDDHVYVVDEDDQTVQKFTREGERLAVFGTSGQASDTGYLPDSGNLKARVTSIARAAGPFNHPTAVAVAPSGDLFVADGYGNSRVHHFRGDGTFVKSWGTPGTGPGEFHVPHGITLDQQGRVLVSDRENDRIQLFSQDGDYLEEWTDIQRPAAAAISSEGLVFVSELPRPVGDWSWVHGTNDSRLSPRVSILDGESGEVIRRLGLTSGDAPCAPGNFAAPHGIEVDSHGDFYVSEVTYSMYARFAVMGPSAVGDDCHTIQKIARCNAHGESGESSVVRLEKPSV
jgi:sugar lactone lactonase YvrE